MEINVFCRPIGGKNVRFNYCCKNIKTSFVSTKQIGCDSVIGVMLKIYFLYEKVHVLGSKMLLKLVQFLVMEEHMINASTV